MKIVILLLELVACCHAFGDKASDGLLLGLKRRSSSGTYVSCVDVPAHVISRAYSNPNCVVSEGNKYCAKFWTTRSPAEASGPWEEWALEGPCETLPDRESATQEKKKKKQKKKKKKKEKKTPSADPASTDVDECQVCWPGTSGPCTNPVNNVCYPFQDGSTCPAGTKRSACPLVATEPPAPEPVANLEPNLEPVSCGDVPAHRHPASVGAKMYAGGDCVVRKGNKYCAKWVTQALPENGDPWVQKGVCDTPQSVTCFDGEKNGNEEGIDCGGDYCSDCESSYGCQFWCDAWSCKNPQCRTCGPLQGCAENGPLNFLTPKTYVSCVDVPAHVISRAYVEGDCVVSEENKYCAKFWTKSFPDEASEHNYDGWALKGICGPPPDPVHVEFIRDESYVVTEDLEQDIANPSESSGLAKDLLDAVDSLPDLQKFVDDSSSVTTLGVVDQFKDANTGRRLLEGRRLLAKTLMEFTAEDDGVFYDIKITEVEGYMAKGTATPVHYGSNSPGCNHKNDGKATTFKAQCSFSNDVIVYEACTLLSTSVKESKKDQTSCTSGRRLLQDFTQAEMKLYKKQQEMSDNGGHIADAYTNGGLPSVAATYLSLVLPAAAMLTAF